MDMTHSTSGNHANLWGAWLTRYGQLACFVLLVVLLSASPAYGDNSEPRALDEEIASLRPDISLLLELSDFAYTSPHPHSEINNLQDVKLIVETSISMQDNTIFSSIEGTLRHSDAPKREELHLSELYFDWRPALNSQFASLLTDMVVRTGLQIFSWGSGTLYNPTDNLSPWYAVDPFNSRRRGIPAASVFLGSGLHTLDLIYITTFEPTELPEIGERFFIYSPKTIPNPFHPLSGPPHLRLNYTNTDKSFAPAGDLSNSQFAIRYAMSLNGWDLALSYFKGYEHTAVFEGIFTKIDLAAGEADVTANYIYPKEQVLGFDVSGYLGKLGLHLEGAFFDMEDTDRRVGVGDEDYLTLLFGGDYSFNDVLGSKDISLSLEYAGEIKDDRDDRIYINRIYKDSLLLRITHTYNYNISGELNYIYNFDTDGSYFNIAYSYQHSDFLRFVLDSDIFEGPDDCFFGAYDKNDRISGSIEVSF